MWILKVKGSKEHLDLLFTDQVSLRLFVTHPSSHMLTCMAWHLYAFGCVCLAEQVLFPISKAQVVFLIVRTNLVHLSK